MNVVVGNSIKIETQLDMGTEQFKAQLFNGLKWSEFLFTSHQCQLPINDFNSFEYLGCNRLILEDDELLVDTIITASSEVMTQIQIVVDIYRDDFDFNDLVNNIIENSSLFNHSSP